MYYGELLSLAQGHNPTPLPTYQSNTKLVRDSILNLLLGGTKG